VFIKKTIELTKDEISEILMGISTRELCHELYSRDAEPVVDYLTETQQLDLLQKLLKDLPISPEIEEELKFQMRRRKLQAFDTLSLEEIMELLFREYELSRILEIVAQLLRDQKS